MTTNTHLIVEGASVEASEDVRSAIAHARITGSVGCTYNNTKVQRLYTHTGGINGSSIATDHWLVTEPDGSTHVVTSH